MIRSAKTSGLAAATAVTLLAASWGAQPAVRADQGGIPHWMVPTATPAQSRTTWLDRLSDPTAAPTQTPSDAPAPTSTPRPADTPVPTTSPTRTPAPLTEYATV